MRAPIERLLAPESVAVVGTSPSGGRGTRFHANLLRFGFQGRLYAVNPRYQEVLGTPCYPSVEALPEAVDCVVVAVAADPTLAILERCAQVGVGGAVAVASGFAEAGRLDRQAALRDIAERGNLAVCGPNCVGLWNVANRTAAFSPPLGAPPSPGGVAILAQSGGLLLEVLAPLVERGVGFSHVLSTGNEGATTIEDFLSYLIEQPSVELAVAIVESFKRPRRLPEVLARAAELGKPVIVLKVGRSERGQRAARSHTGSLAEDDHVVDAVLRQGGAIRVRSTDHLVESVVLFERGSLPRPGGVALVSTSGGRCTLLGDLAADVALPLVDFALETRQTLESLLPDFGTPNNPLDPTGVVFDRDEVYWPMLGAVAQDPGVSLLGVYQVARNLNLPGATEQRTHRSVALAREVVRAAHASDKPFVAFSSLVGGSVDPQVVAVLREGGVPLLLGLDAALAAIRSAMDYATHQELVREVPRTSALAEESDESNGANGVSRAAQIDSIVNELKEGRALPEHAGKRLLDAYGIPVPRGGLARTVEEAESLANEIGYPVAAKASAAGLAHKTELGLVRLGLRDAGGVRRAFEELMASGDFDGILIERMEGLEGSSVELIVGARQTDFGPVVMVGSGGVLAEIIRDTRTALAPVDREQALEMLGHVRASRLLAGYRGRPALDVHAAADVVVRLSRLASSLDAVSELEINPLIVNQRGVVAVDALVLGKGS